MLMTLSRSCAGSFYQLRQAWFTSSDDILKVILFSKTIDFFLLSAPKSIPFMNIVGLIACSKQNCNSGIF